MRVDNRWVKQRVEVNSDEWTAITPPLDFDYFGLRCDTSALRIRTDKDQASTEDALGQYQQDGVVASYSLRVFHTISATFLKTRFLAGFPIAWVKSVSPTATVIVTWVL